MYNRVQRIAPYLHDFIKNLTEANTTEIQEYITEIASNREFYSHLEENRSNFRRRRFSFWGWGIDPTLSTVLYTLCRKLRPDSVVETGVASGVSSAHILCALEKNGHGALYSIDLPWGGTTQSGWIIPNYLRHRWQLILGRSSEKLSPLLAKLGTINIFLHDSEHSYQNMLWEFQTAWVYLKTGGILLSHNVDVNDAFSDFCEGVSVKALFLANMGGVVKV